MSHIVFTLEVELECGIGIRSDRGTGAFGTSQANKEASMGRMFPFVTVLAMLCVVAGVFAGEPKPLYDGRLSLPPSPIAPSYTALLKERILPAARQFWQEQEEIATCIIGEEPVAMDIAQGSFTRADSRQQALLYRFCQTGHNRALNGIAVIENDRMVAHILYSGGWDNAIGAMPDLNGNGLSEIVLACGGTNMGQTWKSMAIIEATARGVTAFGRKQIYSDNCGVADTGGKAQAGRLSVKPGKTPLYFRDGFVNTGVCRGVGEWKKFEVRKPIFLDADETEYSLIQ
jgi:hypothetical protein